MRRRQFGRSSSVWRMKRMARRLRAIGVSVVCFDAVVVALSLMGEGGGQAGRPCLVAVIEPEGLVRPPSTVPPLEEKRRMSRSARDRIVQILPYGSN